jgi:hypothetical protein
MDRQSIKEVVSILMESSLYFGTSLRDRWELVQSLATRIKG